VPFGTEPFSVLHTGNKRRHAREHIRVAQDASRKGDCYDNAVAESFFSNLKNELTWHHDFRSRDEARAAIFDYIEVFYNRQRSHQSLDYVSPVRYEEQRVVP
jgi:transposase InsO family protein